MELTKVIAENITRLLEENNLTQGELSNYLDISRQTLSNYLKGKYEPKPINLNLIANALDVNALWLLEVEDIPMLKETYTEYLTASDYSSDSVTVVEWEEGFEANITKEQWTNYYDKIMNLPDVMRTDLFKYVILGVAMAEMKEKADKRTGEN